MLQYLMAIDTVTMTYHRSAYICFNHDTSSIDLKWMGHYRTESHLLGFHRVMVTFYRSSYLSFNQYVGVLIKSEAVGCYSVKLVNLAPKSKTCKRSVRPN